ncbi:Gfo/Idh/MocA family protein [Aerosakkonema sp. BLCC-F183]|uniref:Gfo/Idh/MocA family protein n=1 Tax=Aerosakkonema sp. BLCC-F183 TaxID=3342834 RepID=UPI0035B88E93
MSSPVYFFLTIPIKVGLVGTGYAAKLRAETLQSDPRSHLVAVAGHTPEKTQAFGETYQVEVFLDWQQLLERRDLDLIIISSINSEHGAIARAALDAGKHVVVEYPLSLNPTEAAELIALAQRKGKLLHVEHIELLGGLHQALKQHLPEIGTTFYARYSTIDPKRPAPRRWTYNSALFGFPFSAALSRIHRLTDLFGTVATVSCQSRFWGKESEFYTACLCTAQLRFTSGLIAEVTYGKGEIFWQAARPFEVHGEQGSLIFDGDNGQLVRGEETTPIEVGSRRGLFAKETAMVLDRLLEGKPLYVTPDASLYALKVADAARRSAETGQTIEIL